MKIELNIKASYLANLGAASWGAYEGIREFVQNGKDGETELGAALTVRFRDTGVVDPDDERRGTLGTLVIENEGAVLPHEALLFGHSTKSNRDDTIGKFGEGLKLGMLALVRAGHHVTIRSGSEVWRPAIERSDRFDADVLVVHIDKGRKDVRRVAVEVGGVSSVEWDALRDRFLFLAKDVKKDESVKTDYGSILLSGRFAGMVFVKGIFVQKTESVYGYDLSGMSGVRIDRDRKMVDSFELKYTTQAIWRHAMGARPDLVDRFVTLLEDERTDVEGVTDYNAADLPEAVRQAVAGAFLARHGDRAVPVSSLADSAEVEHLGRRGIVCPKALRAVLETQLGTVTANKAKLAQEVVKRYGWHELESAEKDHLTRALFLVSGQTPIALGDLAIVDYRDPKLMGMYVGSDGTVQIAKKLLADRATTLATLVHEAAHKMGGGDGEKEHVANIERVWSGIVEGLVGSGK